MEVIICNSGSLEAEMGEDSMFEASLGYKVKSGVKNKQTNILGGKEGRTTSDPTQVYCT